MRWLRDLASDCLGALIDRYGPTTVLVVWSVITVLINVVLWLFMHGHMGDALDLLSLGY